MSTAKRRLYYWSTPIVSLGIGVAYLVAFSLADRPVDGAFGFLTMLLTAVGLLVAGRRSETISALLHQDDERIVGIGLRATAAAGGAVIVAVLIGFVVSIAQGHSGSPYDLFGAIGGVSYVAALLWYRVRA